MRSERSAFRKIIGPALALAILAIIIGVWVRALSPLHQVRSQAIRIAKQSGGIKTVTAFYWNKQDESYLTVAGTTAKQQRRFVVIRQKTGKVRVVAQKDGISKNTAVDQAKSAYHPKKILAVGMRYRAKKFVWDIGYETNSGKLGYVTYDFETGEQVASIRNL